MPAMQDGIDANLGTARPLINGPSALVPAGGSVIPSSSDVVRCNPAAAVATLILQKPQDRLGLPREITIINEAAAGSGFTMTFDAVANSFVANGATSVIAATNARKFAWDPGVQLWFPLI